MLNEFKRLLCLLCLLCCVTRSLTNFHINQIASISFYHLVTFSWTLGILRHSTDTCNVSNGVIECPGLIFIFEFVPVVGSGKTAAFLLPILSQIYATGPVSTTVSSQGNAVRTSRLLNG